VNEMASAAGLPCDIDPALCAALRSQKTGELVRLINPQWHIAILIVNPLTPVNMHRVSN